MKFTLVLALGLVIMVIFVFLRNLSATIIPSLALPMSIIGTFSVMYLLGYSLDNLSLMALTLSVGFVVDDAIVMLENIVRHMEMGKSAMQAAVEGSREICHLVLDAVRKCAAVANNKRGPPGVGPKDVCEPSLGVGVVVRGVREGEGLAGHHRQPGGH